MSNLGAKLLNFSDKILSFAKDFEKIPNLYPEIAVLILFPILAVFFGYFHEPWFDEAQAWQIAKCASYKEILFYLPHFEGHPPFWHLILSVFAKNNFPYEITIKSISLFFSYLGVILILFKSPFYRIIKVLLPFTYFLFYHYVIYSRPYCLVMIAFAILAIYFYQKNTKPFIYALGLILLSLTHPYSFVLASFLTLTWFIETIKDKTIKSKKIIFIFFMLGLFYLMLALLMIPDKNNYVFSLPYSSNLFIRLIYTFFIILPDCFIAHVCNFLPYDNISLADIVSGCFIGVLIWYFIYFYTKNKGSVFITFLIPYIPIAILASKYFALQHLTIIYCFIVFICWITLTYQNPQNLLESDNKSQTIEKCFVLFVVLSLFTNLYWNFKSCILDIFVPYTIGKTEAQFIKKYNLDKYRIFVEYETTGEIANPNLNGIWLAVAPYFNKNIFYNFNNGQDSKNYVLHKEVSEAELENLYSKWAKDGLPDVIVGSVDLERNFKKSNLEKNYTIVFSNNASYIYKGILLNEYFSIIQVENSLAKKLGLKKVQPQSKNYKTDLYRISSYILSKLIYAKYEREMKK